MENQRALALSERNSAGTMIKRRGLIAGAAALIAGIAARQGSQPVAASGGGGDQGALNVGSNPWYQPPNLTANTAAVSSAPTVIQAAPNFVNYAGANGADVVLFEVDARPAAPASVTGFYSFGSGNSGIGVYTV